MQKDVIYIDTEDNITDIITKVKESDGKVIALVPPKRIGAIQSAVNLKLVHRAAENAKKHLVIVTNNVALSALAANSGIPIAKNLQSKPEMPEPSELETETEDIIDGNDLPVGDHANMIGAMDDGEKESANKGPAAFGAVGATALAEGVRQKASTGKGALAATAARARTKIPNFDSFRKKLFFGIAGLIALVAFLVWAVVYAPRASIVIKAKTSDAALNTKVSVGVALVTDLQAGTIKAESKPSTKDISVPFTATGQKQVGEKATGTVKFTNSNPSAVTLDAGTALTTSGGLVFLLASTVTVPAAQLSFSCPSYLCPGTVNGSVTASEPGTKYNAASGNLTGAGSGVVASLTAPTAGGTDKTAIVVQQSDIDAVLSDVQKAADAEQAKKELKGEFGANYIVVDDTFKVDTAAVKPTPAVGQETADGKGVMGGKVNYSIVAIPRTEASKYLDAYYAQQVDGKPDQKVYDNGNSNIAFTTPVADKDRYVVTATANGKIGPKIDEKVVKEFARGKKSGEIKLYVEAINGVENADVTFTPFWVTSAPSDSNKIKVQFNLNG